MKNSSGKVVDTLWASDDTRESPNYQQQNSHGVIAIDDIAGSEHEKIAIELAKLDIQIRKCTLCPQREQFPEKFPTIQFRKTNDILFIGREPAKDGWRKSGIAFRKENGSFLPSGLIFNEHLKYIGRDTDSINYVELVKCFPKGGSMRSPAWREVKNCGRWLRRQVSLVRPSCIVSLGKEPARFFVGKVSRLTSVVGKVFYYGEIPIVPIWHPSGRNRKYNWENVEFLETVDELMKCTGRLVGDETLRRII